MLNGFVYVDVRGATFGGYVAEASGVVSANVQLPPGYTAGVERAVRSHGARARAAKGCPAR